MEERTASLYDILDDQITDGDAEQQCDQHAVADLLLRTVEHHETEGAEDPYET